MGEMLLVAVCLAVSVYGVKEAVHGTKALYHHVVHHKKGK